MPRYSLIIATLHDQGDLALCLASLASQVDAPDFEVIIVDQNGDDRLVSLVEPMPTGLPVDSRSIAADNETLRCAMALDGCTLQW